MIKASSVSTFDGPAGRRRHGYDRGVRDLTQGSIGRQLAAMAVPIAASMIFQTLYYLVDLYFVAELGDVAIAGVSAAGNVWFVILALSQVLGVGAVALISQASGRKNRDEANLCFNQSIALAAAFALATLLGGHTLAGAYMRAFGADTATMIAGEQYLHWVIPGFALQFAMVAMGSALRGTGIVKAPMLVQMCTVLLNAVLAPVLIAGWGTGWALGVAGAGLATTIACAVGTIALAFFFVREEKFLAFDRRLVLPRAPVWRALLRVGLPAGGEFGLLFVYMAIIYWAISGFGAEAQAGFGVGTRVMQAMFLPAMAVAFAAAPIAGQNFGARRFDRVRQTFRSATIFGIVLMAFLTLLCQWRPAAFIAAFSSDAAVIEAGEEFLRIISLNFVATGLVFTCSSLFQGLGNTWPALLSMGTRIVTFALPVVWLAFQPWFELHHVWYMSVASMTLQALVSLWLLRREFAIRLKGLAAAGATVSP